MEKKITPDKSQTQNNLANIHIVMQICTSLLFVYGDFLVCTMVKHHEKPPFGNIFLELFFQSKSKTNPMQIYTSSEMMIPRNLQRSDPVNRPRKKPEISFLAKSAQLGIRSVGMNGPKFKFLWKIR